MWDDNRTTFGSSGVWLAWSAVMLTPSVALAQESDLAAGIASHDAATSGTTDVAREGFEAATLDDEDAKNAREVGISVGGLASSGNSRSMAVTSGVKVRVREDDDQLSIAAATNFARSAAADDEPMETTVENYQARIRYDRFLGKGVALFLAASARRDRFQGLDLRLNVDPGIAYYFLDDPRTQLWSEGGYDLQFDQRSQEALDAALAGGTEISDTRLRHSGRLYLGYQANLNDLVSLVTGVEYLQGIPDTRFWRLNWDGGVNSSVSRRFSIATTVSVKYDHTPLPEIESTDVTTAISLVYQML